tara:strand:- start:210 stop:485 length:276 start_codon:yes stop_codon:yes gene_type:complete
MKKSDEKVLKSFIIELEKFNKIFNEVLNESKNEYQRMQSLEKGHAGLIFLREKDCLKRIANLKSFLKRYDDLRNKMSTMVINLQLYYQKKI